LQKLLVAGLLIFLLGLGLLLVGTLGQGSVSAGGVVFIGPFPIVFGSGPGGPALALLSVVIGGVMVALLLIWGWRLMKTKEN
jgi:uncharacterized membrane protein